MPTFYWMKAAFVSVVKFVKERIVFLNTVELYRVRR